MRTKSLLAAVALATASTLALVGVNAPAWANTVYYSVDDSNPYGPMVIGISHASLDDRAPAILYAWQNSQNQLWDKEFVDADVAGHDEYRIINAKSHKCLDKSLDTPDHNGSLVYQYTCLGGTGAGDPRVPDNQRWYQFQLPFSSVGSPGYMHLANVADRRCLDIEGPSDTNAAVLHMWDCYDTWSQRWNLDD
jgi:hypothetical protein